MRRECRERFPRHQLQRKPLLSDPGMHSGTCATHVLWCMSGSLTRGGGENFPGISGVCATHNFVYLVRSPCDYLVPKVTCMTVVSPTENKLEPISSASRRSSPVAQTFLWTRNATATGPENTVSATWCTQWLIEEIMTMTALHYNDVSHWLDASQESALNS